mmetsp:Transcript_9083/g.19695  ORF Transcript_9083/g.19695 Transcript_9083/m.19695 type:complete len:213 (-) Transcript_9083:212-850(-)
MPLTSVRTESCRLHRLPTVRLTSMCPPWTLRFLRATSQRQRRPTCCASTARRTPPPRRHAPSTTPPPWRTHTTRSPISAPQTRLHRSPRFPRRTASLARKAACSHIACRAVLPPPLVRTSRFPRAARRSCRRTMRGGPRPFRSSKLPQLRPGQSPASLRRPSESGTLEAPRLLCAYLISGCQTLSFLRHTATYCSRAPICTRPLKTDALAPL